MSSPIFYQLTKPSQDNEEENSLSGGVEPVSLAPVSHLRKVDLSFYQQPPSAQNSLPSSGLEPKKSSMDAEIVEHKDFEPTQRMEYSEEQNFEPEVKSLSPIFTPEKISPYFVKPLPGYQLNLTDLMPAPVVEKETTAFASKELTQVDFEIDMQAASTVNTVPINPTNALTEPMPEVATKTADTAAMVESQKDQEMSPASVFEKFDSVLEKSKNDSIPIVENSTIEKKNATPVSKTPLDSVEPLSHKPATDMPKKIMDFSSVISGIEVPNSQVLLSKPLVDIAMDNLELVPIEPSIVKEHIAPLEEKSIKVQANMPIHLNLSPAMNTLETPMSLKERVSQACDISNSDIRPLRETLVKDKKENLSTFEKELPKQSTNEMNTNQPLNMNVETASMTTTANFFKGFSKVYRNAAQKELAPVNFLIRNGLTIAKGVMHLAIPFLLTMALIKYVPFVSLTLEQTGSRLITSLYLTSFYLALGTLWLTAWITGSGIVKGTKTAFYKLASIGQKT